MTIELTQDRKGQVGPPGPSQEVSVQKYKKLHKMTVTTVILQASCLNGAYLSATKKARMRVARVAQLTRATVDRRVRKSEVKNTRECLKRQVARSYLKSKLLGKSAIGSR